MVREKRQKRRLGQVDLGSRGQGDTRPALRPAQPQRPGARGQADLQRRIVGRGGRAAERRQNSGQHHVPGKNHYVGALRHHPSQSEDRERRSLRNGRLRPLKPAGAAAEKLPRLRIAQGAVIRNLAKTDLPDAVGFFVSRATQSPPNMHALGRQEHERVTRLELATQGTCSQAS